MKQDDKPRRSTLADHELFDRELSAIRNRTTKPVLYALANVCLMSPDHVRSIITANQAKYDHLSSVATGPASDERADAINSLIEMVRTPKKNPKGPPPK